MADKTDTPIQSPCPSCGGSGHISFFQGESRFLLTVEECPLCFGMGYVPAQSQDRD